MVTEIETLPFLIPIVLITAHMKKKLRPFENRLNAFQKLYLKYEYSCKVYRTPCDISSVVFQFCQGDSQTYELHCDETE